MYEKHKHKSWDGPTHKNIIDTHLFCIKWAISLRVPPWYIKIT